MAEFQYAGGMNRFTAKRFAEYLFGAFFRKVVVDSGRRMFILVMNEYIEVEGGKKQFFKEFFDKDYRNTFKEHWGEVPGLEIKVIKVSEVDLEEEEA